MSDKKLYSDDELLKKAKGICFAHLCDPKDADHFSNDEVTESYEFLYSKFHELSNLRNDLELSKSIFPFVEINQYLEEFKEQNDMYYKKNERLLVKITKEINYNMEQLSLLYGITKQIVNKRKIFKH